VRGWLQKLVDDAATPAAFAVEGCTGWRFVVEELQRAGMEAHLAEPADTSAARGPKRPSPSTSSAESSTPSALPPTGPATPS
jgi:hypothetical protein